MDTDAIVRLLLQAAFGAAGGNIVGNLAKRYDLGVLGNTIAGIIGGGFGCQVLALFLGGSHAAGRGLGASAKITGLTRNGVNCDQFEGSRPKPGERRSMMKSCRLYDASLNVTIGGTR
jgi:hypothetical protein